jgi:putative cell wall-binding protein
MLMESKNSAKKSSINSKERKISKMPKQLLKMEDRFKRKELQENQSLEVQVKNHLDHNPLWP